MTKIIGIEGNIGVGKTTFVNLLMKNFENSCIVTEPVDMWLNIKDENKNNLLDIFYKDTKRWSYTFQNIAYLTRMMKIEDKIRENKYDYIFLDRSLNTDKNVFEKMLYDDGMINELEHSAYNMWYDFYNKYVNNIKEYKTIYLRAEPEICAERIKIRNRKEEANITIEYLKKIHKYHDDWLCDFNKKNILSVDCDNDFEHDINKQTYIINSVKRFV
jgi:deoxyadenosine/deoxycytidine kinase